MWQISLQEFAFRSDKTVKMIEDSGIIQGATFFGKILKTSDLESKARKEKRSLWFNNSKLMLKDSVLIFADPDNGMMIMDESTRLKIKGDI